MWFPAFFELVLILLVPVFGFTPFQRNVKDFSLSQLLGEWYDIGRTTFIKGPDTWSSQQWNFVQGQDGTVVALYNGWCKTCGGCSETTVFSVKDGDNSGDFILEGSGETWLFHVESNLRTELTVSICFNPEEMSDCPRSKLQVSVLSRQPKMNDVLRWPDIIHHLPVSMAYIDSSSGDQCPDLFIDSKLVTADLVENTTMRLVNKVGYSDPASFVYLPCSVGHQVDDNYQVVWLREKDNTVLTVNDKVVMEKDSGAILLQTQTPGTFDLLLSSVYEGDDEGVYTCRLERGDVHVTLNRVVVSSGGSEAPPMIVYHSKNVTALKGESAVMECYVNGYLPSHVTWWIKTRSEPDAFLRIGEAGFRMMIPNAQTSDEGVYKCEAYNGLVSPVSAFINLQVGFVPEINVNKSTHSVPFYGDVILTCNVTIYTANKLTWQKDGVDIKHNFRHAMRVTQTSTHQRKLTLHLRQLHKEDFGRYTCVAKDYQYGESSSHVMVTEKPLDGEQCEVRNIPVMKNFNIHQFLGDMEMIQTTHFMSDNATFDSMLQGLFITLSGSLVRYYRAFSRADQHCLDPEMLSLVRLDVPGDYIQPYNGFRGRYKVVYTDYTYAVVYFCLSSDDRKACPRNLTSVQIFSRVPKIPYNELQRLYRHVVKTCVPVTSLLDTVPGICKISNEFMRRNGQLSQYSENNCQVVSLQAEGGVTVKDVAGEWHLIGEVRPQDYSVAPRESMYIVPSADKLILFYRGLRSGLCSTCETSKLGGRCSVCEMSQLELCSATEAGVLHKSRATGGYYFDYRGLTVDSVILYADGTSLVLYTCLALRHDGTCHEGAQLVDLFHRNLNIDNYSMLWLIRSVANACIDIKKLRRFQPSGTCPVPAIVATAAEARLVASDHSYIGCHHKLIPIAEGFHQDKFAGRWLVFHRNLGSLAQFNTSLKQFSQSYEVVKRPGGKLLLLTRQFESQWNKCSPTVSMEMKQRSGPGDYIHTPKSGTVLFKVLSLHEDTAVVYWCHKVTSQGVCHPDSLVVEILVRATSTKVSEERLKAMLQISMDVCVRMEDFQPTSQTEKCTIPTKITQLAEKGEITSEFDVPVLTCEDQMLRGAAGLKVRKLTGAWTVMWRNKYFWGMEAPYDESSFLIRTRLGLTYLWRSYNNDLGRCQPAEGGRFVMTSSPADYYSGFDDVPVTMKILWTDYRTMLAMWCHLDNTSRCHPHRTTVEILTRGHAVDNATCLAILASVNFTCLDSLEWVPSHQPDTCRVGNDVLTAAYIDGFSTEYSKIGCQVDLIGGKARLTDDLIIGTWHSVYQSKLSTSDRPIASTIFHFTKTAAGPVSLLFRPYSVDKEQCLPARMVELTRDVGHRGTAFKLTHCATDVAYGYVYVVYGDGDHLALVMCDMHIDNLCDPATLTLTLLHREGTSMTLNQTLVDLVTGLGADACVDHGSLAHPTLKPCPIAQPILTDMALGNLKTCAREGNVQCYPQYIPVHKGFDLKEFSGRWYTVRDSEGGFWPDDRPVGSATYHFLSMGNGTVAMLYSAVIAEDQCYPVQMRLIRTSGQPGEFVFAFNNTQAVMKVAWMNEEFAVTYWCFDAGRGDPWCQHKPHVSVLSRQQQSVELSLPSRVESIVADVCAFVKDLITPASEPCEIPNNIVTAVESGSTAVSSAFSRIQCAQEFISVVTDFDMEQFSGVWHTVSQMRQKWGEETWDSLIRSFVMRDNGTFMMAFTGYITSDSQCMPMEVLTINVTGRSAGHWTYTEGNNTVTVKVVWTDYNTSALLYSCWGPVRDDGLCDPAGLQVEFLSRTPDLTPEAEKVLRAVLPSVCVPQKDVANINTGLCVITKDLQHIVGSALKEDNETLTSCKVKDIPLEKNFSLHQMTGVWYEIARTRFTFNTMESVISVYYDNPGKDFIEGLFTGTLHKQCQSPLKSTTRKKIPDGPDPIIEARIQAGESIFPWITFRVLYFDGNMLMHLACYAENEDGTCNMDKMEVTLLGRSRHLDPQVAEKLEVLMATACLKPEDLVLTKETVDCMPKLMTTGEETASLPDTSACLLTEIPVVENLNEEDLLGTWYGLGSLDYKTNDQPAGFVVSVSRGSPSMLQWRQWNIRDGRCEAEKTVHVKAACRESNSGDYISTRSSSFMLQWTTLKIVNFTGDLLLVYTCVEETDQGFCTPAGIRLDLLGRSKLPFAPDMTPFHRTLDSLCLKPQYLKLTKASDACDHLAAEAAPVFENSTCSLDRMPAINVNTEQVSGLWYTMVHSVDSMLPAKDMIIAYKPKPDQGLSMYLTILDLNDQCMGPMQGEMKRRCHDNPGSDFMGRLKFPGIWSWAPWKVLHADYNASLIALTCMDQLPDGSCSDQGVKVHFLSREPRPSRALRAQMYRKFHARTSGCFCRLKLRNVYNEERQCEYRLKPILGMGA